MRKVILFIVIILMGYGCTVTTITGVYSSSCRLYNVPDIQIRILDNGKFEYYKAMLDDTISGSWIISYDTLRLHSEFFTDSFKMRKFPDTPIEFTPNYKYTDYREQDLFLIKRNKLIPLKTNGVRQSCVIRKINN